MGTIRVRKITTSRPAAGRPTRFACHRQRRLMRQGARVLPPRLGPSSVSSTASRLRAGDSRRARPAVTGRVWKGTRLRRVRGRARTCRAKIVRLQLHGEDDPTSTNSSPTSAVARTTRAAKNRLMAPRRSIRSVVILLIRRVAAKRASRRSLFDSISRVNAADAGCRHRQPRSERERGGVRPARTGSRGVVLNDAASATDNGRPSRRSR